MQMETYATVEEITVVRITTLFATLMLHMWNVLNLHGSKPEIITLVETFTDIQRRSIFMKMQLQQLLSLGSTTSTNKEDNVDDHLIPPSDLVLHAPFNVKEFRLDT